MHKGLPLTALGLLTVIAFAPAAAAAGPPGHDSSAALASAFCPVLAPAGLAAGEPAPPVLYAIPDSLLSDGKNQVRVEVRVDGERYVEERFTIHTEAVARARQQAAGWERRRSNERTSAASAAEVVVLELLAERPEIRAHIFELSDSGHRIEVEVLIDDDRTAFQRSLEELTAAVGELLATAGPPVAVDAAAQAFAIGADAGEPPSSFYVCGDGSCGGGTPPIGENCESCPEDCGGACSICGNGFCGSIETCSSCPSDCGTCPICPQSLGTEARAQVLNSYWYPEQCRDGVFGRAFYSETQYYYKRFLVERIRQCNGSITETIVPGSTTYHWSYCYWYSGGSCSFSWGSAFPPC